MACAGKQTRAREGVLSRVTSLFTNTPCPCEAGIPFCIFARAGQCGHQRLIPTLAGFCGHLRQNGMVHWLLARAVVDGSRCSDSAEVDDTWCPDSAVLDGTRCSDSAVVDDKRSCPPAQTLTNGKCTIPFAQTALAVSDCVDGTHRIGGKRRGWPGKRKLGLARANDGGKRDCRKVCVGLKKLHPTLCV